VLAAQKGQLVADFSESRDFGNKVTDIVRLAIEGYVTESYDEVYVVYSDFITALSQEPVVKKILPIETEELSEGYETGDLKGRRERVGNQETSTGSYFTYEPDPVTVLTDLLPYYIEIQIAESLYEAEASEHSARMIAMKNASDNASELTEGLSLEYNKARQSMITTEISDITTAQESLK
jgi:F-type H+-transporting ATPase subunit gamma